MRARALRLALTLALPALLGGCTTDALCNGDYGQCNTVFESTIAATSFDTPWDRARAETALAELGYELTEPAVGQNNTTFRGDDIRGTHFSGTRDIRLLVPQAHIDNASSVWAYIVTFDHPSDQVIPERIAQERYLAAKPGHEDVFERELEAFEEATGWIHQPAVEWRPQFSRA